MIDDILDRLVLILNGMTLSAGTLTVTKVRQTDNDHTYPAAIVFPGAAVHNKIDDDVYFTERRFYIELFYAPATNDDVVAATPDVDVFEAVELIVRELMRRQRLEYNDAGLSRVEDVFVRSDNGAGLGYDNVNSVQGTLIEFDVQYSSLIEGA